MHSGPVLAMYRFQVAWRQSGQPVHDAQQRKGLCFAAPFDSDRESTIVPHEEPVDMMLT